MIEYLEDESVVCGKVYRHINSGSDKANRIWVYSNDLGEEYLSGDKYSCQKKASQDLRACRLDLVVEYTAVGSIHKFEFSDAFQSQNMNDLLRKLKYARGNAGQLEKELKEVREERDHLRRMLGVIQEYIKEGL